MKKDDFQNRVAVLKHELSSMQEGIRNMFEDRISVLEQIQE